MGTAKRNVKRGKRAGNGEKGHAPVLGASRTVRSRRRKVLFVALTIALVCAVVTIVVESISRRGQKSVLVSLKTEGMDPIIVAAIEEAQEAVRRAPGSGDAWGKLGQILFVHGLDGPAAEAFAHASELAAGEARWPYLRGRALRRENGDAALPFLRRAAELCRGEPAAPALTLAELLIERGELVDAEAQIDLVLKRNPIDARALLDRGRLEIARGQWQAAQRHLVASITNAPNVKVSHVLLATVNGRLNDAASAAHETQVARTLPENPRWADPFIEEISSLALGRAALLERAELLLSAGHVKETITTLTAASAQYPGDADVALKLGDAYRADGQLQQAEKAFRQAIAARPESSEARLRLAAALAGERRFADALPVLREAVRASPNLPETHYRLAECLLRLGERTEAVAEFAESVHVEPSFRQGYVAWGMALKGEGRLGDAAAQLRKALELDPQDGGTAEVLKQIEGAGRNPGKP